MLDKLESNENVYQKQLKINDIINAANIELEKKGCYIRLYTWYHRETDMQMLNGDICIKL